VHLTRRKLTPRLVAANRHNSLKSTGPKTQLGKRHSSLNAGKHLVFATVMEPRMKELGESPEEFRRLHTSLCKTFQPRDGFEQLLVDDMAEIRWRRQRLIRAEAGILASNKRKLELDRQWQLADYGRGAGGLAHALRVADFGLCGLPPSPSNFREILASLRTLKESIEVRGFRHEDRCVLDLVYGEKGTLEGSHLRGLFDRQCGHGGAKNGSDPNEPEVTRRRFVEELDAEIASFNKLAELCYARDVEVTDSVRDSHLLPSQEDLEKIMRYEASLERQFERKVQQLVAWRRAGVETRAASESPVR
jgi:hypothetical protein